MQSLRVDEDAAPLRDGDAPAVDEEEDAPREDETVLDFIVPMPVYEAVGERRKAIDEDSAV